MEIILNLLILTMCALFVVMVVAFVGAFLFGPMLEGLVGYRRAEEVRRKMGKKYVEPRLAKWLE